MAEVLFTGAASGMEVAFRARITEEILCQAQREYGTLAWHQLKQVVIAPGAARGLQAQLVFQDGTELELPCILLCVA